MVPDVDLLIVGERGAQSCLGADAAEDPSAHLAVEQLESTTAGDLGVVGRGIGVAEQIGGAGLPGAEGDADAGAHHTVVAA